MIIHTPDFDEADNFSELEQRTQHLEELCEHLSSKITFIAEFESKLIDAFDKEIELLEAIVSNTQNDLQKRNARFTARSLQRIKNRWVNGTCYSLDVGDKKIIMSE